MKWNELNDEMQVRLYWEWQNGYEDEDGMTFEEFDTYMNDNFGDYDIFITRKGE